MPEMQAPNEAPHIRHAATLPMIDREIAFLEAEVASAPTDVRLATKLGSLRAERKHTADRLEFAKMAAALCDQLGLTHEVTRDTVTYNDGVNFVSKVLHELAHGVKTSQYARSHVHVRGLETQWDGEDGKKIDVVHCDEAKFTAPRDPAAEVIEHLGVKDPAKGALIQKLFATIVVPGSLSA
jgi:hypothetical protein